MATGQRFTAEDRRNQILEIATELFSRQGFDGTTTRSIADRAHVNEAIIFRHFPTKEDLYRAVLEKKTIETGSSTQVKQRLAAGGDLRTTLLDIAEIMLRARTKDETLTRLFLYTALENHELLHKLFCCYVMDTLQTFANYVQEQMDKGLLRQGNAMGLARGFFGMVTHHVLMHNLFGGEKQFTPDLREASHTLVDIWLYGALADDSPARKH